MTRSRRARKPKSEASPTRSVGDQVGVVFGDELYGGEIIHLTTRTAKVKFEDGDVETVSLDELGPHPRKRGSTDSTEQSPSDGFTQHSVKWDDNHASFACNVDDVHIWGCWRRTKFNDRSIGYAIDMWAKIKDENGVERQYVLGESARDGTISYTFDPREKPESLDKDICARINMFLYDQLSREKYKLAELHRRADHPEINIRRAEGLDRLIMKLQEVRDTCFRCGGQRQCRIEGDLPGDPTVDININITTQAVAVDGKPPSLEHGSVFDGVTGRKGEKGGVIERTPDMSNVMDLVEQLERVKDDKGRARRIRAVLRKMGHTGGARAIRAKLAAQANATTITTAKDSDNGQGNEEGKQQRKQRKRGRRAGRSRAGSGAA